MCVSFILNEPVLEIVVSTVFDLTAGFWGYYHVHYVTMSTLNMSLKNSDMFYVMSSSPDTAWP